MADIAYPGILILFFIATIATFFLATRFITSRINDVFSSEVSTSGGALDRERYTLVAKKINISLVPEEATSTKETMMPEATATTTAAAEISAPPLDKKSITLMVKNSTAKKGLASILAKELEAAGFSMPKAGNETGHYATTTILVKESKHNYAALLLEVVARSYPAAVTATTTDSAPYDATIIIGEK